MKAATPNFDHNHAVRLFQSTPPVKAATIYLPRMLLLYQQISIHAAREGGDAVEKSDAAFMNISIHAAREGGDLGLLYSTPISWAFQSTPPVKAATAISLCPDSAIAFQSTPPVKAATGALFAPKTRWGFQSTPPVKAATEGYMYVCIPL